MYATTHTHTHKQEAEEQTKTHTHKQEAEAGRKEEAESKRKQEEEEAKRQEEEAKRQVDKENSLLEQLAEMGFTDKQQNILLLRQMRYEMHQVNTHYGDVHINAHHRINCIATTGAGITWTGSSSSLRA